MEKMDWKWEMGDGRREEIKGEENMCSIGPPADLTGWMMANRQRVADN
jgi:hypothetical protein